MNVDVDDEFLSETSVACLDEVPLERLEAQLIGWAGHLAAATARWLLWLAAYDRREGWGQWGCRSAAHWLSWKCGMSLHTARVHVRVARALDELPLVSEAFLAGQLSFSKVRALTRLAGPIDEVEMVEAARTATASQLDRIVAGCRRVAESDDPDPSPETRPAAARYRQRGRPDGSVEIVLTASAEEADRIDAAVRAVADRAVAERDPSMAVKDRVDHLGGWDEILADAATALLTSTAEHTGPDPVELVVEVEAAPTDRHATDRHAPDHHTTRQRDCVEGACAASGRHLPNAVVRRLGCDAVITIARGPAPGDDGPSPGVGRRSRVVPAWLRRQVERRDHHTCQYPGCATRRRLHAHHIIHWLDLGPTDLENLILLCGFHHHLVHEGGWTITGPASKHQIRRPDGTPVGVDRLHGDPSALAAVTPASTNALEAWWSGEPLDVTYAVSVYVDNGSVAVPHSPTGTPLTTASDPGLN